MGMSRDDERGRYTADAVIEPLPLTHNPPSGEGPQRVR